MCCVDAMSHGAILLAPLDYVKSEFYNLNYSIISKSPQIIMKSLMKFFSRERIAEYNSVASRIAEWVNKRYAPEVSARHYLHGVDYF